MQFDSQYTGPTVNLRFIKRKLAENEAALGHPFKYVLQQQWRVVTAGPTEFEWRDVPLVAEGNDAAPD